jgi:Flp pilus assembly protein TadG
MLQIRRSLERRRLRRGQGLVEFVIVLPILALLLLGIIQFAFIFAAQIGVTNAVREAARVAAVTPTETDAEAAVFARDIYLRLTNATNGLLKQNVFAFAAGNIVTSGAPDTQVCYRDEAATASGEYSVFVKVEGGYRHPLFIPLLSGLLDGLDGVSDGGLRIGTSEEMRVENQVLLASPAVSECYNP